MRRFPRVSGLQFLVVLSLFAAASSHAQRVTTLNPGGTLVEDTCGAPRCFPSVAGVDGDTAIMTNNGVTVFVRSAPGVWNRQQILWNPAGMPTRTDPNVNMGGPAGLSGDVLLVAGTSRIYNNVPVLYAWQRTGTAWTHTQVLAIPRPSGFREMRVVSVKLSQKTAAVCSIHTDIDTGTGESHTQIDIYTLQANGKFLRQAQILPSITLGAIFDCQLALEGTTLLVADPMHNNATGRVLAYQRGSGGWALKRTLTASDSSQGAEFGTSIAISGNTIVASALRRPNYDYPQHLGAAYLFQRTATGWAQVQILVKPEFPSDDIPSENDAFFGFEVSISGDRLVVSSNEFEFSAPSSYLYERRGVWAPVAGLVPSPEGSFTGGAGLLSGSVAVQRVSDGHSGSGAVTYELPPLWELPPRIEP